MSARERFIAFRRSLPRTPPLTAQRVAARGLDFAVFSTPPVPGRLPLFCVNGGLLYSHKLLWPALSPLAADQQLIFFDQRGRGDTPPPPGAQAARIEHDAGDVAALRIALGYRKWNLLGHSWGGGISTLAAEQDRDGVEKLVLVNSVGPTSDWIAGLHENALARLSPSDRALLRRLDPATLHEPDPARHSAYSRAVYPAWFADAEMAQLFAPPRSESLTGTAIAARLRRDGYDWRRLVHGVQSEGLVVHGERDLLPIAVARELVGLIPKARLELIPDAGHMPFWESPQHFFGVVQSFLR